MTSFLSEFSQPFLLAVACWPFASLLLTLPVLALLYHRDNRLRFSAVLTAYLVVLYLLGLACFTLYPLPADPVAYCAAHHLSPQLNPLQFIDDVASDGLTAILQIVMNIVFFLPLGFFMGRTFRFRLRVALPLGFAASLLIETAQLTGIFGLFPCAYRLFDVDDLIWNTSGALIGFAAAMLVNRVFPVTVLEDDVITDRPGFIRRTIAFLIDQMLASVISLPFSFLVFAGLAALGGERVWRAGSVGSMAVFALSFAVLEIVVPWRRGGRTLGGGFLRMSAETKPRQGAARVVFYVARFVSLYAVTLFGHSDLSPWPQLWVLFLLGFWVVMRRMPYDLLP